MVSGDPSALLPRRHAAVPLVVPLAALLALLLAVTVVLIPATARADGGEPADPADPPVQPVPTVLSLTAPAEADAVTFAPLTATLRRADTEAVVAGARVRFERRSAGAWRLVEERRTDAAGVARSRLAVRHAVADNAVRAVFAGRPTDPATPGEPPLAGAESAPATVRPLVHPSALTLSGWARIVDGGSFHLRLRWKVRDGRPVPGTADLWRSRERGAWTKVSTVRLDARGAAGIRVTPRHDTRWRAVGRPAKWWTGDTSQVHAVDNVPPGVPVAYPAAAPRPKPLPRQPRAVGAGPNAVVSAVPDPVWRSMVGRSWHRGCPVGRSQLRLVRVNHWGYDGYRYRGELVVHRLVARKTVGAFGDLYWARLPVRAMYRVDRFGWSSRLGGADNYGSMAAGNTSAFNCRGVVGNPRVRSPHSYGRSLDLNTWENPYHSRTGIVPNTWWATRSHPQIGWRDSSHRVVRILRANGFRWTYGNADAHHFDG